MSPRSKIIAFLQSTSPLFILLLAPLLLGEHATRRDIAQMAVMGVGMVLFLFGIDRPSATAPNPALGNGLAAICAVTWAFTVIGYRWLPGAGSPSPLPQSRATRPRPRSRS